MLKFFKRRRLTPVPAGDDPLAIRDLLEQPALRALVLTDRDTAADADTTETTVSPVWHRLVASGPIRFDRPTYSDVAA